MSTKNILKTIKDKQIEYVDLSLLTQGENFNM